ncbi:CHAT domain-containing protein [Angustibacter sp. McL0619]|uniref:CHAT domain-containing protein n=1 Tax=Angustibacter sp. McL0619 TaxID=3415676 RepID=UPI003CE7117B
MTQTERVPTMTVPRQTVVAARSMRDDRVQELAAEAMELVGTDPSAAIAQAEFALASARGRKDAAARTLAWRALGLGARAKGDLATADGALLRAVRSATQAGDPQGAAEARMTRSFVLLDLGKTSQALRQSGTAADVLDGLPKARLEAQRALILQRCGRFGEALEVYDRVVPVFVASGDEVWESRARGNRGILHAFRGEIAEAEQDLDRTRELFLAAGRELDAAGAMWNLGCLARERSDVVLALERFDEADPICDRHGYIVGLRLLDRASLMLACGVVTEARQLAERALQALAEANQGADLMECQALLARITLLDADPVSAVEYARSARQLAARQGRKGWVLQARLLELLALEEQGEPGLDRRARALVSALDEARWADAATEARLAAARAASASGRHGQADVLLSEAKDATVGASTVTRIRYWHAAALLRQRRGDAQGAASAVRAGMTVLSRHRAGLGASDLQAHVPALAQDLARVGIRVALDSGSADRLLREVERWRGQDLRSRPVRPPRDPELSQAIERLRRASTEAQEAGVGASGDRSAALTLAARERDVVRLSRRAEPGAWSPPLPPASAVELVRGLAGRSFVEYVVTEGDLLALTLAGTGSARVRLHHLGRVREVEDRLAHLQFALARLATGRGSPGALAAALAGAQESASQLDQLLVTPLHEALQLAGAEGLPGVVVAPTEALHAVPWALLPSLQGCPTHLVRSGTAWLAARSNRSMRAPKSVDRPEVFVTGPGVTLAPTMPEHRARFATVQFGAAATVATTLELLDGASVAHVAAHGRFRSDNPLLSSLRLADGDLTVYDLEGLRRPPELVVLAACHSAAAQVLPGNQLLGVAHALLTMGSAGVIATTLPTPDEETAVLMDALHRNLADGLDAGAALLAARRTLDLGSPAGYATSAGFDLYGC